MVHYLIEFRFHGYARQYSKNLIYTISRIFKVRGVTRKRAVPHVTLFGPFRCRNERLLTSKIVNACSPYELIPFRVKGFGYFNNPTNKKVVYMNIESSEKLKELRRSIAKKLLKTTHTVSSFDRKYNFEFHATLAFKDIDKKFKSIKTFLNRQQIPNINQHLLRITVLKGKKILFEYDLLQKKTLTRREAKNRKIWSRTINQLKSKTSSFSQDIDNKTQLEKIKDFVKWYI